MSNYTLITPVEFKSLDRSLYFLLDVQNQEEFAARHIKDSINIPCGANFPIWAKTFIPEGLPIIIMAATHDDANSVIIELPSIDQLQYVVLANTIFFSVLDEYTNSFPITTQNEILQSVKEIEIIDVRTDAEWDQGHIPDAKHHDILSLKETLNTIEKDKNIAFICGSGYRASIAASLAKKAGFTNVCNIKGGMRAWNL